MEKLYYTAKEVAEMLDVSVSHAYKVIREDENISMEMLCEENTYDMFICNAHYLLEFHDNSS